MNKIFRNALEIKNALPINKNFTLVGGCFDLIHVGHIHLLEYAANLEQMLVVAVLSDNYIMTYKDRRRPIINQKQRARMVASIWCVDFVYISDTSPSSTETLKLLRPHSVVFSNSPENTTRTPQRLKNIANASPTTKVQFLHNYTEESVSTSTIINKVRSMEY